MVIKLEFVLAEDKKNINKRGRKLKPLGQSVIYPGLEFP